MTITHLAGIVPVAGQPLDFNMPWHDSLMPIAQDYLAVERSVTECAYAGCETIWVVCNFDMQPLIRHRLGDYIQDPVWVFRKHEFSQTDHQKLIPIYYVPIHPRDKNKRDCLSWSVLYGAWRARKTLGSLSTWVKPEKYYVSFPYGVYHPSTLRKHRQAISSNKDFFLSHEGRTVIDGEYLGFTLDNEAIEELTKEVRMKSTGLFRDEERTERLPLDERFSYRFFSVEQVFNSLDLNDVYIHDIDFYWNIDCWENYCSYIKNGQHKIKRPSEYILKYKEWNGIGIDETS